MRNIIKKDIGTQFNSQSKTAIILNIMWYINAVKKILNCNDFLCAIKNVYIGLQKKLCNYFDSDYESLKLVIYGIN